MSELVLYPISPEININLNLDSNDIWISQKQMALLFGVTAPTINEHLNNIFDTKELSKDSTIRKFRIVQNEGGRQVSREIDHYNLDAIISVGYRVNSRQATVFRQWATKVLRQYIEDGYVINEQVLADNPNKLSELAAKIRALRSTEKNIFSQVRDCFKISASDYQPNAQEVKTFYALLQDKFHHAITQMTASKLIMDRADFTIPDMGLVSFKELIPTKDEVKVGKNYLTASELHRMHLLSEQFLLYAESTALRGKQMTMKSLQQQLDKLLILNEYPVLNGYDDYLKSDAIHHAEREHNNYIKCKKLEMIGIKVDPVEFANGAYDEYNDQIEQISMQKLRKHFANPPKQIN